MVSVNKASKTANLAGNAKARKPLPTGFVCHERPKRRTPRVFKAQDVGRITCYAIRDGALPEDVIAAISECLPVDIECEKTKQSLKRYQAAVGAFAAIAAFFVPQLRVVSRVVGIFRLVFPQQARQIEGIIDEAITEIEKTQKILDKIIAETKIPEPA